MPAMTQRPTPTTLLCPVWQEGVLPCFWHTDSHDCYFLSTKKIIAVLTVSRSDHGIAQTRELVCTKFVVPQAIARGMFNEYMCAHAHNIWLYRSESCGGCSWYSKVGIKVCQNRLRADKFLRYLAWYAMYYSDACFQYINNSGTKNVKKSMEKITKGRVMDKGKTWFPELVDKCMFIHITW